MWASYYFLHINHSGTMVLLWGGGVGRRAAHPQVKNPWGDHLKFKNLCHFQYDTTKVDQLLRLFTIIKL